MCVTGLTGVCHLWDLPWVNCLTHVSLGRGASGQFLVYLELFLLGFVKVFPSVQVVFLGVFLFQGLEKSMRLSGTLVVRLL
jgi:hypothetical protein